MRFAPAGGLALVLGALLARAASGAGPVAAPEFPTADPAHWVGAPARMSALRGSVVLLDVWTFG